MNDLTAAERRFLEEYDPSRYDRPSVAVDLVVMTIEDGALKALMIRRSEPPFRGCLALPGVFVRIDESLEEAAVRGLFEETGLRDLYLEQLFTWGAVERDPRMRVISVSYLALVPCEHLRFSAGSRTTEAGLKDVKALLAGSEPLAFDHRAILETARQRVANKVEYTPIAFSFVPEEFTLPELQRVYEILLDRPLYKANFRKKLAPMVEETGRMSSGAANRPSRFYRQKREK